MLEDLFAEHHASLMTTFHEACSKMDIEHVQHDSSGKNHVGAQASTTLAVPPSKVVVFADPHGQATQSQVAISAAVKPTILSEADLISRQQRLTEALATPAEEMLARWGRMVENASAGATDKNPAIANE